jgi:hypothetical protein
MVESLFTKEHINSTRPHIQETVNSLLHIILKEEIAGKTFDIVEKFALPVPSYVTPLPLFPAKEHKLILGRLFMASSACLSQTSPT